MKKDRPYAGLTDEELMAIITSAASDEEVGQAFTEIVRREFATASLLPLILEGRLDAAQAEAVFSDLPEHVRAERLQDAKDLAKFVQILRQVPRERKSIVVQAISDFSEEYEESLTPRDHLLGKIAGLYTEFRQAGHAIEDIDAFLEELGELIVTVDILSEARESPPSEPEEGSTESGETIH